ncbi:MAG: CopG antitoxin of type toxin-antitoxin system [Clostridia bacterium]|nr:CopG antitoxin of type toxin-antitoxin system [Clostridia bacterium]
MQKQKQTKINLTVRLDPEDLGELKRQATIKGIGPATLARIMIREQLKRNDEIR